MPVQLVVLPPSSHVSEHASPACTLRSTMQVLPASPPAWHDTRLAPSAAHSTSALQGAPGATVPLNTVSHAGIVDAEKASHAVPSMERALFRHRAPAAAS